MTKRNISLQSVGLIFFMAMVLIFLGCKPVQATDLLPRDFRMLTQLTRALPQGIEKTSKNEFNFEPITTQPTQGTLTNNCDEHLKQWYKNTEVLFEPYKNALKILKKEEKLHQKNGGPPPESLTNAQEKLRKLEDRFIGYRGHFQTFQDKSQLEIFIFVSLKNMSSLKAKKLPSYQTDNPRQLSEDHKVLSFVMAPEELALVTQKLSYLCENLERELYALERVLFYYNRDFIVAMNGWTPEKLGNWWNQKKELIPNIQTAIDEDVRRKFDDRAEYRGDGASVKKARAQKLLKFRPLDRKLQTWSAGIRKYDPDHSLMVIDVEEQQFKRLYYSDPLDNLGTQVFDETQTEWVISGQTSLDIVEIFSQKCLAKKERVMATFLNIHGKGGIRKMVSLRRPFDGTEEFEEYKSLPKGMEMACEYRTYNTMLFHRKYYQDVMKELMQKTGETFKLKGFTLEKKRRHPKFKSDNLLQILKRIRTPLHNTSDASTWEYDDGLLEQYQKDFQKYKRLLEEQKRLHLQLHKRPNRWVPYPWELFFQHTAHSQDLSKLDLSEAELSDQILGKSMGVDSPLTKYKEVNLSQNPMLVGNLQFRFNDTLCILHINHCHLASLQIVSTAPNLQELDASNNQLQDLNPLSNCTKLVILNLSHNFMSGLASTVLPEALQGSLQELDVSHCENLEVDEGFLKTFGSLKNFKHEGTQKKLEKKPEDDK